MSRLSIVSERINAHLHEIEAYFEPHCKLTLLMRNPKSDDGDAIWTNENLDDVIKAIQKLKKKKPRERAGTVPERRNHDETENRIP